MRECAAAFTAVPSVLSSTPSSSRFASSLSYGMEAASGKAGEDVAAIFSSTALLLDPFLPFFFFFVSLLSEIAPPVVSSICALTFCFFFISRTQVCCNLPSAEPITVGALPPPKSVNQTQDHHSVLLICYELIIFSVSHHLFCIIKPCQKL